MNQLALVGGTIITPLEERVADVFVQNGIIQKLDTSSDSNSSTEILDVSQCYVTPGLIDLQLNGGPGCDFWQEPTAQDVSALSRHLLSAGVTTFLPTLITADIGHMRKNIEFLESIGVGQSGSASSFGVVTGCQARMPGVHLEGPCLSPQRPGVHPANWLQPLSKNLLSRLISPSIKLVTLAPELEPSHEGVRYLQSCAIEVSLGHSNATFEEAQSAFEQGIKLVTHTYNAMPPLHHRAPGAVIAAMLDDRVTCCVICDGLHVDPPAVKLLIKTKGVDKVILVTDAAAIGTTGGGLVGSSINLDEAVRNVVTWGAATFAQAIKMAAFNPAATMGWLDRIGQIKEGNCADLVVWDRKNLSIKAVIAAGLIVFRA